MNSSSQPASSVAVKSKIARLETPLRESMAINFSSSVTTRLRSLAGIADFSVERCKRTIRRSPPKLHCEISNRALEFSRHADEGYIGFRPRPTAREARKMRLLHTMIRTGNLDRSVDFYTRVLGMKLLRRKDYPE